MSGEPPACAKQKSRSGPSGWKKYNAWRSETGQRIDPYVRKHPSRTVQLGDSEILLISAVAEPSVLPAVSGSARQQHAAADPLSTAIVPALNAKRSDSAVAERIRPSQDSAVAEGVTIHAATPSQESAVAEWGNNTCCNAVAGARSCGRGPITCCNTVTGLRSCGRGLAP